MMSLPNFLTLFRLVSAPAVAIAFVLLPRGVADWAALILFIAASVTDWLDGYLARAWNQISKLGTMLDPIADKAMVVIALATLVHVSSLGEILLFPAAIILFREVFVSGLREYLGDVAGTLRVTRLAKWKTAVQMIAIAVLLAQGLLEHLLGTTLYGMDPDTHAAIIAGDLPDTLGLWWKDAGYGLASWAGIGLIWLAAVLTAITGLDYFLKARPHLEE